MGNTEKIVQDRKLNLCPNTADWSVPELLRECPVCGDFMLYCCACNNKNYKLNRRRATPCHHYRIVFTDGACANNGQPTAKAGVGVAHGSDNSSQFSIPITDIVDNFPFRSNQRAELCAAKLGLEFLAEASVMHYKGEARAWILATDSAYVVKGITEWLPTWRVCSNHLAPAPPVRILTEFTEEQLAHVQGY